MSKSQSKRIKKSGLSAESYTGELSTVENGEVTIFHRDKLAAEFKDGLPDEILGNLCRAAGIMCLDYDGRGGKGINTAQKLRVYNKYVPALIRAYRVQEELIGALLKENQRLQNNSLERSRKRWSSDEDETLIEMVSQETNSLAQIAISMGRTPAAIQTRISQLVGISKLSSKVAGRFIGTLNGQEVEGSLNGTLLRDNGGAK